jgi:hypothetical protein
MKRRAWDRAGGASESLAHNIRVCQPWFTPRFHLHHRSCRSIGAGVKRHLTFLVPILVVLSSCEEKKEAIVTETRKPTTRDSAPKLFTTSDERFRNAKPSPVKGEPPDDWLVLPATDIRLLNYRFGQSGTGEVWVSISSGTVLDNVNRWINKQFAAPAIDEAAMEKLRTVPFAGSSGVWVEATGQYSPGMGSPAKSGYALAGVIAHINGKILTVKMVGPQAEVEAARPALEAFAKKLKWID